MNYSTQRSVRTSEEWERTLGISQRVSAVDFGWHGEIRLRYTDFQVYEIGPDGNVIHLRDTTAVPADHAVVESEPQGVASGAPTAELEKQQVLGFEKDGSEPAPATDAEPARESVRQEDGRQEGEGKGGQEQQNDDPQPTEQNIQELASLAGDTFAQQIADLYRERLLDTGKDPSARKDLRVKTDPISDKSTRGKIHAVIRTVFVSRIDTTTDDSGAIEARLVWRERRKKGNRPRQPPQERPQRRQQRQRKQQQQQIPTGEYLHFTLFKENRDTMEAVQHLSRVLHLKPAQIATAGTKDRRAATAQRCSIRHCQAQRVARTNGRVFGVVTGDFAYSGRPIHLGWHRGNEFVITAKNCRLSAAECDGGDGKGAIMSMEERLAAMRERVGRAVRDTAAAGWINYFGHQRFGTHETGTHEIGMLILQGNFEGAVQALLHHDADAATKSDEEEAAKGGAGAGAGGEGGAGGPGGGERAGGAGTVAAAGEGPRGQDSVNRNRACMLFARGEAKKALAILPRRYSAEMSVMTHLSKNTTSRHNYVNAIGSITRGLRTIYLHAYQSLVWNHVASRRWELYGPRVVEGDLVVIASQDGQGPDWTQDGEEAEGWEGREEGERVRDEDSEVQWRVRPVTAAEASSGAFSIHHVVLPTPGTDVTYPTNEAGHFYAEFMGRPENGGLDPHMMHRPQREFSLRGRYRSFVARFLAEPRWEVRPYGTVKEQMHPTDMDRIREVRRQREDSEQRENAEQRENDEQREKSKEMHKGHEIESRRGRGERHEREKRGRDTEAGDDGEGASKRPRVEEESGGGGGGEGQSPARPAEVGDGNGMPVDDDGKPQGNGEGGGVGDGDDSAETALGAGGEETAPARPRDNIAVILTFQLPKSAYATVVLREVMGRPSDWARVGTASEAR